MLGRTTRLEFIIVTVAFLVLLLCSKPPRPGTAEVADFYRQAAPSEGATLEITPAISIIPASVDVNLVEPAVEEAAPPNTPESSADIDEEPPAPEEATKRVAAVDARRCARLKYDDVMYGEVTVRWVWDGQKLVPQKVCIVKEPNGVSTVWSFDQQDNAVLSEIDRVPNSGQ